MDEQRIQLPDNWEHCSEGDFCLSCRRGRAVEAAQAAMPSDSNADARAKARRAGLIEFELKRTPDRTDSIIARACHTSASAVAGARRRLCVGDGPPPRTSGGPAAARQAAAGGR